MRTKNLSSPAWTHETRVVISSKPRDASTARKLEASGAIKFLPNLSHVMTDIGGINKIRMQQLQDQFKLAVDKIDNETKNLDSLKAKKKKLKNKLIDIYQFLLKNPHIIL